MVCLGPKRPSLVSCRVHQASREDVPRSVVAIAGEDILGEARVQDNGTYREARMVNREDRWDSTRLCLDLQVHPR